MSLVGLADDIWSEVVLRDEEKSWQKDGDAVNVCDFGGAVGELWKIILCFGLKDGAVADSDWDEGDWESGSAERRFDKHDDDCDDCGDNMSCNVSIINFENFMFPFSVRWSWSL